MISINQVINNALNKKTGDRFEIKDLFSDPYWKSQTRQHRQKLGSKFAKYVRSSKDFKLVCRKSDNHKVYERL